MLLLDGNDLTEDEMVFSMTEIMEGKCLTDSQLAAFLTALHIKGETVAEIVGCGPGDADKSREAQYQGDTFGRHLRNGWRRCGYF